MHQHHVYHISRYMIGSTMELEKIEKFTYIWRSICELTYNKKLKDNLPGDKHELIQNQCIVYLGLKIRETILLNILTTQILIMGYWKHRYKI